MSPGFRSLMWYLLFGTRGGPNRQRLLEELERSPANAHQLSEQVGLDYRTVRHHLRILERNGAVIRPVGDAYATPYEICASTSAYLETLRTPSVPGSGRPRAERLATRPTSTASSGGSR
ncbi:MAG TPA: winged helix-turn-helix domain-containing protein [Thermoplasmata archaeon]|nr:winged helix-turn-helix domain-containing protein [Thermoplasmata archaeon]